MADSTKVIPISRERQPDEDEVREVARGWRRVLEMGERDRMRERGERFIKLSI